MKKITFLVLITICLTILYSCECRRVDCRGTDYKYLNFLSKADSSDLILSGQYELNSLKITPIFEGSTGADPGILIASDNINSYTAAVPASLKVSGYAIQLDSLPPDTLLTTVDVSSGSKCCSGITFFTQVVLNGDTLASGFNDWVIKIFK